MNIPLSRAEPNHPLRLIQVENLSLLARFHHMGLYENDILTRLDEEIMVQPVRIRGPRGDCIVGKGMGSKIVAHLDDDRKLPVVAMKPGESGHIEGIVGGNKLSEAMDTLGLKNNDFITLMHRIPPMEYTLLIDNQRREKINEGLAAKIWGTLEGRHLQFCSAGKNKTFQVEKILGGKRAAEIVRMHGGICPGVTLVLESVKPADTLFNGGTTNPIIISTKDGLRLFLDETSCERIIVQPI